jgi:hypothetical protein
MIDITDRREVLYNNQNQFSVFMKLVRLVKNVSGNQIFVSHVLYTWKCERRRGFVALPLALRVFENRVLKEISGPTSEEVTGEWRGLHNEETIWKTQAGMGVIILK